MPTPNPIREPGEDDILDQLRPKPSQPRENKPSTEAEQSRVLPIAYGTCKVPLNLIEKYAPVLSAYPVWTNSTAYQVGDRVRADSKVYECVWAGVSGSRAPRGKDPALDGTVDWEYVQDQPMPIYYQMFVAALCEGQVAGALKIYWDKETFSASPTGDVIYYKGLEVKFGPDAGGQALHGAIDFCGYQHTALLVPFSFSSCSSGTQQEMPAIAVELKGLLLGTTGPDVNPADIIVDVLTHARRGCGLPSSIIGASITGTGAASYRTYCDALGLRLSMLLDSQQTALQILAALFLATNTEACFTGGELKAASLDDQACSSPAFGATNYVPATDAVYDLGPDDFADKREPVQVQRRSDADCFNCFPMEYTDRAQGYARVTVEDPDMVDVHERGGLRRAGPVSLHAIYPDGTQPVRLSRVAAQRSLKIRNRYTFRLPWRFILLEPLDVVTLTEPEVGLNLTPVRILSITEEGEVLSVIAEDYPAGVAAAAAYTPQVGDGYVPAERTTTQVIPSSIDGETSALASGVVGPAAEILTRRSDNLVPNGDFLIWSAPRTPEANAPDCWEVGTSPLSGVYDADPDRWAAASAASRIYFTSLSDSGNRALEFVRPAAADPDVALAFWMIDDAAIPVRPGHVYDVRSAVRYTATPGGENSPATLWWHFLDSDKQEITAERLSTLLYNGSMPIDTWLPYRWPVRAPDTARLLRFAVTAKYSYTWNQRFLLDRIVAREVPASFLVTKGAALSIPSGTTPAIVTFDSYGFSRGSSNDGSYLDTTTGRFTAYVAGRYSFNGSVGLTDLPATATMQASLTVNGVAVTKSLRQTGLGTGLATLAQLAMGLLLEQGDIVDLRVVHSHTAAVSVSTAASETFFGGSGS